MAISSTFLIIVKGEHTYSSRQERVWEVPLAMQKQGDMLRYDTISMAFKLNDNCIQMYSMQVLSM